MPHEGNICEITCVQQSWLSDIITGYENDVEPQRVLLVGLLARKQLMQTSSTVRVLLKDLFKNDCISCFRL